MANTTKSTKSKTKTSATRTGGVNKSTKTKAVSAKKVSSKRSTKAVASTGNNKSKITVVSKAKKRPRLPRVSTLKTFKLARAVTSSTLRGLHFVTIGASLLLIIATGYLMNNASFQFTFGHLAKDELTGSLVPAVQSVFDIDLRWIVIVILLLSIIMPILYLTKLSNRYNAFLKDTRMLPLRWIDFGIIGGLIIMTTALLTGASDIPTLKLLGGFMIVSALAGLISERQNSQAKVVVRSAYYTSVLAGLIPLLFIAVYIVTGVIFSTAWLPWYVYALFVVVLFQYVGWMRNLRLQLGGKDNFVAERNYLATGFLTKVAFAIVLIIAFFR